MVVSMDISAHARDGRAGCARASLFRLLQIALFLVLAILICSAPADAKKRVKRSHYSPPQAAMVLDAYTGKVLFADNADKPRYPASVTKVMTLYILFEHIRDGRLSLETEMPVSAYAASRPPSNLNLQPGGAITVRNAMYALVTKSANDVASVVAEAIAGSEEAFARMMTQKARSIGMTSTIFRNASGLPDAAQTTTARDLVTLGRRMLADFPEQSKIFQTRFFQYGKARYKNHNSLLFSYQGMEGMKTGFTNASGFNLLASCRRHNKHLIAVVLGGRSSGQRNARMRELLNSAWTKAVALNNLKPPREDKPMAEAGVLQADLMPERNPAFHDGQADEAPGDKVLEVEIASPAAPSAAEPKPAAVASLPAQPGIQTAAAIAAAPEDLDADEEEAELEEGDAESVAETGGAQRIAAIAATDAASEPERDAVTVTVTPEADRLGPYHVQVGSYLDAVSAKARLAEVAGKAASLLKGHGELTVTGDVKGKSYFRARFGQFSQNEAASTCAKLKRLSIDCIALRAE
jgi:D-alanyl-D-alanine carboxypeptidase